MTAGQVGLSGMVFDSRHSSRATCSQGVVLDETKTYVYDCIILKPSPRMKQTVSRVDAP